ncbi:MAG: manganese efflux pump MntP family protein [Oscillospiraceae bacterium]|nr:manganese efflux pump MntP family protein [Oscillospiraceae bacterium]
MGFIELLLLSIGLAMDASAVSMTNGMYYKKIKLGWTIAIGTCFGIMQGVMPLIGFVCGSLFSNMISQFDHYIALILLGFIGGKMIYEALHESEEKHESVMTFKLLILQGIATSIDALAVGISFAAFDNFRILPAITAITLVTLVLSIISVYLGKKFGTLLNEKAEIIGGLILVGIGLKIFIEHMWLS